MKHKNAHYFTVIKQLAINTHCLQEMAADVPEMILEMTKK